MNSDVDRDQVVELQLGIRPEAAVSEALLFQTEEMTHLLFSAMRVVHHTSAPDTIEDAGTAIVEFTRCLATRFGYPNDEARWGIPRFAHAPYGIYEVSCSTWIEDVVRLNRFRFPQTRDDYVKKHYLFTFHDSTFECLADAMKLELTTEAPRVIVQRLAERMF